MINRVVLVGRITRDPELKHTNSQIPVVNFTLAVNRQFTSQSGEREADFINCVVWRRQAETLAQYIRKGALLGVEGTIQTGSYTAEDGTTRYTTDVVCSNVQFLESKGSSDQSSQNVDHNKEVNSDEFYGSDKNITSDDDLPF